MIKKVKYGNCIIQYDLIKSKRIKTSQITVTSSGVTVRTPQTKSTMDVKNMIQQRLQWIFKKQLHFAKHKKPIFSIKSTLSVQGKDYKIHIIPTSVEKTILLGNTIEFHIPQKKHTTKQIKKQYQTYLEKRSNVLFPKLVHDLEKQIGVHPTKINIKELKDRWGSSTHTEEINLNYNLMKAPRSIINYVILHELCHFKIKEHSSRFWNLMAKHMPEYGESVKWLEMNGIRIN
ncbi:MAG: M48 family metallopeptidase [Nitrosopumilus sp.]|nr:M48 family metallopeptidase [Nitrosopumilus sp.]NRA05946.1 M48 family metallopeptidase [Nitrosopumilus sp.]